MNKKQINKTLSEIHKKENEILQEGTKLKSLIEKNTCEMLEYMDGSIDVEDDEELLTLNNNLVGDVRTIKNNDSGGFTIVYDSLPSLPSKTLTHRDMSSVHGYVHRKYIQYLQD